MHLHLVDIITIGVYLATSVFVGYWVSKRASRDIRSYFLGGNQMPWYVLGTLNMSRRGLGSIGLDASGHTVTVREEGP